QPGDDLTNKRPDAGRLLPLALASLRHIHSSHKNNAQQKDKLAEDVTNLEATPQSDATLDHWVDQFWAWTSITPMYRDAWGSQIFDQPSPSLLLFLHTSRRHSRRIPQLDPNHE